MATALELVNRVRRQLRWNDTASFTASEDKAVLDAVNAAVAVIFERWDWECDVRHDGVLFTMPEITSTGCSITTDTTTLTWGSGDDGGDTYAAASIENVTNPVVYAVLTDDTDYGDTAFRVSDLAVVTSGFFTVTEANLASRFPGATDSSAGVTLVANTYVLPSTVRKVMRVRHQERDVALLEAERFHLFDRAVQRPHDSTSDNPDVIVMGGIETSTTYTALLTDTSTAVTGPSVTLWPTPSSELLLNYSYLMKRAEMTATTDTLANADRSLEDLVVQLAYARCVQNYVGDADAGTGLAIEQRVLGLAKDLYANQTKDPNRRRVMSSNFDDCAGRVDFGRMPRNFGTGS